MTNEDRQGRPPSTTEHRHKPREREPVEITAKITSEVVPQRRQTLLESAHDVGGISVFIYLFAKVGSAPVYEFGYFRFPKKTLLTASHLVSL